MIYLAKEGVKEADLIVSGKGLSKTVVKEGKTRIGTLYSKPSVTHEPSWLSFFGDSVDPAKLKLKSAGAAAVLVVKVSGRLAAVCFGYGRYLIESGAVESSFGLKTILNCVGDEGVRSIDRKTFEGITTHVREQASKQGSLATFGLNVERDLLRAVVGKPKENRHGGRLAGKDGLAATAHVTLGGLRDLLKEYERLAAAKDYKTRFPWIDNISEVQDAATIASLDLEVVDRIKSRNFDRMWLAVPDLMEWSNVGGFRYGTGKTGESMDDIHLASYADYVRSLDDLSLDRLKNHRVVSYSATSDASLDRWPVYKCIYAEVDRPDGTYLLNNGGWFLIDAGFAAKVNRGIAAIPETSLSLLAARAKESEEAYNTRLAKSLSGSRLMDKKNILYGGGKSRIEFCDVLTAQKHMVHIKKYSGSAVLSHLFAQGLVAAQTFVQDAEFRKQLNPKLGGLKLTDPMKKPTASQYELAYVVISQSQKKLQLPFFSRVTLRNAHDLATSLGYKVTLTSVPVE